MKVFTLKKDDRRIQEIESMLEKEYMESILNNKFNKRGFQIGDAVYIETTNSVGRIIDGGNTETWGNQCRTDTEGVRSFSKLKHFEPDHLKINGVCVHTSFNPEVKRYDPDRIRKYCAGYAFGKYTPYATDAEIIMITERSDKAARLHNAGQPCDIYRDFIKSMRNHVKQRAEREQSA